MPNGLNYHSLQHGLGLAAQLCPWNYPPFLGFLESDFCKEFFQESGDIY